MIFLREIIDDPNGDIFLVTDYYSNGSLGDILRNLNAQWLEHNQMCKEKGQVNKIKSSGLKEWQARFYFIDLLKALHYCHEVINVVHKDIKPDNIMIGHNKEAILIDFGVAALTENQSQEDSKSRDNEFKQLKVGTYMFFAPELFGDKHQFGEKTDIWAMGVSFY